MGLIFLFFAALGTALSTIGLFAITPMTAGWLGCGIIAGLCYAFWIWGVTLNGFDSYMEAIMWFTGPLAVLCCLFSVWCLGVFVWRGTGLHLSVVVS